MPAGNHNGGEGAASYDRGVDVIKFRSTGQEGVRTLINGQDLRDIIGSRGWYGFYPQFALPPADALLGGDPGRVNSYDPQSSPRGLPVLVCGCGEAGCASILVDIRIDRGEVVWSDFRELRPGGDRTLRGVRPFRFAISQYRAALRALLEELRVHGPWG